MWKLRIIPEVRVFWWRVLKELLPSYSILAHRQVMEMASCKLCGHAEESLFHALIDCELPSYFGLPWKSNTAIGN